MSAVEESRWRDLWLDWGMVLLVALFPAAPASIAVAFWQGLTGSSSIFKPGGIGFLIGLVAVILVVWEAEARETTLLREATELGGFIVGIWGVPVLMTWMVLWLAG